MSDGVYRPSPIIRSLIALALLAGGMAEYRPIVRQELLKDRGAWAGRRTLAARDFACVFNNGVLRCD